MRADCVGHESSIGLRRYQVDDRGWFFSLVRNPDVRRHMNGPMPLTKAQRLFDRFLRGDGPDLRARLMEVDGRRAGHGAIFRGGHGPEVGILLSPGFWGRGLALRLSREMREIAFSEMGFTRLVATISEGHHTAAKVADRLGMEFVRRVTDCGGSPYLVFELRPVPHEPLLQRRKPRPGLS